MPYQFSKDRKTVLVSNSGVTVSSTATSFGVASTAVADFPTGPRVFEVQSTGESLLVGAGFGTTTWSGITRGINGTTAATILDNSVLLEITGANEFASFVQQGDAALTNVRSIKKTGSAALTGDVTLTPGTNVTLTQAGQDITIASTGGGGGGSGTVTSVGLSLPGDFIVSGSPVTGAGTLTAVRNVQSANAVFAGPATGSPASPTYRALVQADIPALDASQLTTGALTKARQNANTAYTDVATAFAVEVTVPDLKITGLTGSTQASRQVGATASGAPTTGPHLVGDASLSLADGKWYVCTVAGTPGTFVSAAGSGTVTSVGLSVPSALLNVSGSPITGSGTIAVSLATQSANTVLAGPTTGSAATPTMRALTPADIPAGWTTKTANYTITTTDSGIAVDATSANITITLPTAIGATQQYAIKKVDSSAHTVTIATTGGQAIEGVTTQVLRVLGQDLVVASDGANWFVLAGFTPAPLTTEGDLLYLHSSILTRLGIGANKTVLASDGTDPGYVALDLSYLGQSGATIGQVGTWNGSAWVPATPASGQLLVQDGVTSPPVPLYTEDGTDFLYAD